MKKFAMLFMVLTMGCVSVYASDRSETKSESNDSAPYGFTKICTVAVYQDDWRGGHLPPYNMDLVQSDEGRGLASQGRYDVLWPIQRNPLYKKTSDWKGRYNWKGTVSGVEVYFYWSGR